MPNSIRPGDVLAGRYLLVDLLSESGNGRFWRAHDRILDRHVAVHVIAADDDRAEGMMEAARRSATVLDRRILRVLDVDQHGRRLLRRQRVGLRHLPRHPGRQRGPARRPPGGLDRLRGGRVDRGRPRARGRPRPAGARERPDRPAAARSGVIGFSVDAALLGLPARPGVLRRDRPRRRSSTSCSPASGPASRAPPYPPRRRRAAGCSGRARSGPGSRGRWTPCATRCINPHAATGGSRPRTRRPPPRSATAARLRRRPDRYGGGRGSRRPAQRVARHRDPAAPAGARPRRPPAPARSRARRPSRQSRAEPEPVPEPAGDPGTDQPTQAGLPIFDDETDDVSWFCRARRARHRRRRRSRSRPSGRCSPPTRPTASPVAQAASRRTHAATPEYWPWDAAPAPAPRQRPAAASSRSPDDEDEDDGVPGRSWLRLAGVARLPAAPAARDHRRLQPGPRTHPARVESLPESDQPPSTPAADGVRAAAPLTGLTADRPRPAGRPAGGEPRPRSAGRRRRPGDGLAHPDLRAELRPRRPQDRRGLTLDLGGAQQVSAVDLTLVGAPTGVALYVTDEAAHRRRGAQARSPSETVDGRPRSGSPWTSRPPAASWWSG